MKQLPVRFWIGLSLIVDGALLIIFHMPLTYALVGKTRTKLGLLFGIDRLHFFMWGLYAAALLCLVVGIAFIYFSLSRSRPAQAQ